MKQMPHIIDQIELLFFDFKNIEIASISKIPQSGSDRSYYRFIANNTSYIATYSENIKENKSFIYFSNHFKNLGLPVPKVFCVNNNNSIYIQEDIGTQSLLDNLELHGYNDLVFQLFKDSLSQLAKIQIIGNNNIDYNNCITAKEFGKEAIMSDLLYFKYYFLDTLQKPYDKQQLLQDFEAISTYLTFTEHKYFMFRDFQSRNILVNNNKVHFIDFQGGMRGALQYDVASLLWQAKAQLSQQWKDSLLQFYIAEVENLLAKKIDKNTFISQYNGYVLLRLLQVLGAYGFRGLFERKAHFLSSIPLALGNLKYFIANNTIGIATPEFDKVMQLICHNDVIASFTPVQANENTKLKVEINSFSYKKSIPKDTSGNGGGFVFDMRGILNPGRFEDYKYLSGQDESVKLFLEQQTKMPAFLNSIYDLVDINIEDYLTRGFENLQINFGCTGGQHRSVYAANEVARHIRNKYKLLPKVAHTNCENWLVKPIN
jgi:aminoglycoside/choline kinase family phosphotransferase